MAAVQIPAKAVSNDDDIVAPTRKVLEDLNLLGTDAQVEEAGSLAAVLSGPPQSVALIEAGATAAAKWWAAGLGATVVAAWTTVVGWWGNQTNSIKVTVVGAAAIFTSAVVLAIGYLIASDVRGRAAAAVATIDARRAVAVTMIQAAREAYDPLPTVSDVQVIALPSALQVKKTDEAGANKDGWQAIALERQPDGELRYVVVKDSIQAVSPVSRLKFE